MEFSDRISRISVSSTAAVVQKADKLRATGAKLVDFGAGEPDFPTPDHIKQAAVRALEENFTKYTPTGGTRELKEALVDRHAKDFGSNYTVEECLVTVGGKQAIFEAMMATLNDGDEVILPVPYWVSFLDIINYAGGKAVFLETDEAENFAVRAEAVEKLITPRTRMIVVNSPNNPTGAAVPREEMERLLAVAVRHKVLLLSDECYCHFVYDDPPFSLGSFQGSRASADRGLAFQDLCHDGLARGICPGQRQASCQYAEAAKPLDFQSHLDRAEGRGGGLARPAGFRARHAGGISPPPRPRGGRPARHSPASPARCRKGRSTPIPIFRLT